MDSAKVWGEAITVSLMDVGQKVINFLPKVFGAMIVLLLGWIIAVALGKLMTNIVSKLGLDRAVEKLSFQKKIAETGMQLLPSIFIGGLVKWFLALVFLMASTSILELTQVTIFLNSIVVYLPNVFVAVIILTFVFLLGNFTYHIVKSATRAAGVVSAALLATISKWAIIIFGIFAALIQLGVASSLVSIVFTGVVAMLSLAGGLAFGLGGKDEAKLILRKLRKELTERQ